MGADPVSFGIPRILLCRKPGKRNTGKALWRASLESGYSSGHRECGSVFLLSVPSAITCLFSVGLLRRPVLLGGCKDRVCLPQDSHRIYPVAVIQKAI